MSPSRLSKSCASRNWCGCRQLLSYENLAFLKGALPIDFVDQDAGVDGHVLDVLVLTERTPLQREDTFGWLLTHQSNDEATRPTDITSGKAVAFACRLRMLYDGPSAWLTSRTQACACESSLASRPRLAAVEPLCAAGLEAPQMIAFENADRLPARGLRHSTLLPFFYRLSCNQS